MYRTALVALGGLVGSVARFWVSVWIQNLTGSELPIGTLVVNFLGSFVIGVAMTLSLERGVLGADARLLLTTGFCGGFTTMSTFAHESLALFDGGSRLAAASNVVVTLVGCLVSVWLGTRAGRLV